MSPWLLYFLALRLAFGAGKFVCRCMDYVMSFYVILYKRRPETSFAYKNRCRARRICLLLCYVLSGVCYLLREFMRFGVELSLSLAKVRLYVTVTVKPIKIDILCCIASLMSCSHVNIFTATNFVSEAEEYLPI